MALGVIFSSFFAALSQLSDRRFRRVVFIGVALAIALLYAAYAAFLWFIESSMGPSATLPLVGEITWLKDLLGWASLFTMLILSMFLMVPVASAITSLFLDDVAQAVEDRHYPALGPARAVSFGAAFKETANFLGILIGANVVAIAAYALFSFAAPLIFWALNGYLLGREYFLLAATRRIGRPAALKLRKAHQGTIWLAGILMAVPLTVPLLNLLIPILGAATFTHLFHRLADPFD